jgi:hypothetical protein
LPGIAIERLPGDVKTERGPGTDALETYPTHSAIFIPRWVAEGWPGLVSQIDQMGALGEAMRSKSRMAAGKTGPSAQTLW